jgi:hypothetical protein
LVPTVQVVIAAQLSELPVLNVLPAVQAPHTRSLSASQAAPPEPLMP